MKLKKLDRREKYLRGKHDFIVHTLRKAQIIAIVHRHNEVEDKFVAAPEGMRFTKIEIEEA